MNFDEFKKLTDEIYGKMTTEEMRANFAKYGYSFNDVEDQSLKEIEIVIPQNGVCKTKEKRSTFSSAGSVPFESEESPDFAKAA